MIVFLVGGHLFLPPDGASGIIEQKIRHQKEVILPNKYEEIYSDAGRLWKVNE